MLCISCVEEFPEAERHGMYCHKCYLDLTAGVKWKEDCAPAQEEKEMELNPYDPNVTVAMMEEENAMKQAEDALVAELSERWDRAYFAALTGTCMNPQITNYAAAVTEASCVATETIRRHADMMASRDAVIAEVAG